MKEKHHLSFLRLLPFTRRQKLFFAPLSLSLACEIWTGLRGSVSTRVPYWQQPFVVQHSRVCSDKNEGWNFPLRLMQLKWDVTNVGNLWPGPGRPNEGDHWRLQEVLNSPQFIQEEQTLVTEIRWDFSISDGLLRSQGCRLDKERKTGKKSEEGQKRVILEERERVSIKLVFLFVINCDVHSGVNGGRMCLYSCRSTSKINSFSWSEASSQPQSIREDVNAEIVFMKKSLQQ